jgi:hypothetical protein
VRTRHGDVMLLTEFMRTRVLELAVHGLDLATGLGRDPWLTGAGAAGRSPLTAAERQVVESTGVRWLALG